MRSGRYVKQPTGYSAFIPVPLPPQPSLAMSEEMIRLLFEAGLAVGRLDGLTNTVRTPYVTASRLVNRFVDLGILQETNGKQRHRLFRYDSYLALFESKKQEAGA